MFFLIFEIFKFNDNYLKMEEKEKQLSEEEIIDNVRNK